MKWKQKPYSTLRRGNGAVVKEKGWRRWFAWHPVEVAPYQWVWLETVERYSYYLDRGFFKSGWVHYYREVGAGDSVIEVDTPEDSLRRAHLAGCSTYNRVRADGAQLEFRVAAYLTYREAEDS